ncbi:hypothetical protein GGG16DRAFT_63703 [Schizophyllum commune]
MVNTPRLYVDLIFRQSGCFANWDPTTVLRVGDYGTVRENDGELDVQGNIYDDGFGEKYGLQLPLPVTNTPSGEAVPQIANCTLKGQWEAGDGENALLLLPNTVRVSLPGSCKKALAERIYDDMKDFSFVTDVYHTPDYALFVNHSQKRSLVLALQAAPPGANPVSSPSAPSTASTPQALASALASAMPDAKVSVSGQWIAIGHVDVLKTSTPLDFGTVTMPVVQVPAPGSTSSTPSAGVPNGGAQPSSTTRPEKSLHVLAATHDSAEDASERAVKNDAHASPSPHVAPDKAILPSATDAWDRELLDRLNAAVMKPYEVGVDKATVATSAAEVNAILSEMVPGETTTDTVTRKVAVLAAAQKQLEASRALAADSTAASPASTANAPSATSTTESSTASHGAPSSAPTSQAPSSRSIRSHYRTDLEPSTPLLVFGTPRLKDKTRMFFERAVGNGEEKAAEDVGAKGDGVEEMGNGAGSTGYGMMDACLPWDAAA